MKRSEINKIITDAMAFLKQRQIEFPPFAHWGLEEWKKAGEEYQELKDNMLGWDITDFGYGDYHKIGVLIFTFRNGNFHNKEKYPKMYAEKMLLVEAGQELPYHFHWSKMEDIINRGGGNLILQMYNADENDEFADTDVHVTIDGRAIVLPPGGKVTLRPGESITILPRQYHRWIAEAGTGRVLLFEVSTTNDDMVDNRFYDAKDRIPTIEEDEAPRYLIFDDYKRIKEM